MDLKAAGNYEVKGICYHYVLRMYLHGLSTTFVVYHL